MAILTPLVVAACSEAERKSPPKSYATRTWTPATLASARVDHDQNSGFNAQDVWSFVSEPKLSPMRVAVKVNKPGTAPGLIFVAPFSLGGEPVIGQTGALILDSNADPIWFRPLSSTGVMNADFRVQSYGGQRVLTWWQGTISGPLTATNLPAGDPEPGARYYIFDSSYRLLTSLSAQKGFASDLHEFSITERGTALFTSVKQVPADLTSYGGPENGFFDDHAIQEIDLRTGELVFFWDMLDHVNPADSQVPASSATSTNNIWDCFHVNSLEEGTNGDLLISARNMWAIYSIDKATGNVRWQLGGKNSDFVLEPGADFYWQHDARFRDGNTISLFDNGCCGFQQQPPEQESHGLILTIDFEKKTASADRAYYHDPALFAPSQGNFQKLSNGNEFIGWGQKPYYSEYAAAGNTAGNGSLNVLYDARMPGDNQSYRAFKNEWVGTPYYPPSVAVREEGGQNVVYASWNGSTETSAWQALAGPSPTKLSLVVDRAPRQGFETAIRVNAAGPYFQVKALDSAGKVLGASLEVELTR